MRIPFLPCRSAHQLTCNLQSASYHVPMPPQAPVEAPERSPLDEALGLVGDRWTLLLVEKLLAGPCRFKDLAERMPGIASNVLSQRLKSLERHGLLVAVPYSRRPVRHS